MKKSIFAMAAMAAMVLFSCSEDANINAPGDNEYNYDSIPVFVPDTDGIEISIDSAIAICKTLPADMPTAETYKLSGVLTVNSTSPEDAIKYKNINFKMSDNGGKTSITCYKIKNINNTKFTRTSQVPLVGSKLTVRGHLVQYKGSTPEIAEGGFIVRIDSMVAPVPAQTIHATCAEAKAAAMALASGATSNDIYIIEGYVQSEGYSSTISKGQQIFWMDDVKSGKKVFEAYYCDVPNGEAVPVGAKVRLTGKIMNYNNSIAEIKNGKVEIIEMP